MNTRQKRIEEILKKSLNPYILEVIDFSEEHMGHSGAGDGGESHIRIRIGSPQLANIPLLEAHRRIHSLLKEEFQIGLHALEIEILK